MVSFQAVADQDIAYLPGQIPRFVVGHRAYGSNVIRCSCCLKWDSIMCKTVVSHREKEMATHSSTLVWKISWMEEPGRLQSMGSQRVWHDWATKKKKKKNSSGRYIKTQRSMLLKLENEGKSGARFAWDLAPTLVRIPHIYYNVTLL